MDPASPFASEIETVSPLTRITPLPPASPFAGGEDPLQALTNPTPEQKEAAKRAARIAAEKRAEIKRRRKKEEKERRTRVEQQAKDLAAAAAELERQKMHDEYADCEAFGIF